MHYLAFWDVTTAGKKSFFGGCHYDESSPEDDQYKILTYLVLLSRV